MVSAKGMACETSLLCACPPQCIRRVSEHLEDAGVEHADIGQVVKQQFVALVEDHFLQRVRLPSGELLTIAHGSQDVGGVSTIEVYRRFELPPSTEGMVA